MLVPGIDSFGMGMGMVFLLLRNKVHPKIRRFYLCWFLFALEGWKPGLVELHATDVIKNVWNGHNIDGAILRALVKYTNDERQCELHQIQNYVMERIDVCEYKCIMHACVIQSENLNCE